MVQDLKPMRELSDIQGVGVFMPKIRIFAILVVATLSLLTTTIFAQGASISGKVIDVDTKEGLPGVTVLIPTLKIGAKTDSKGNFKIINVPSGKQSIEARLIGYKTQTSSADVDAAVGANVNFMLSAKALQQDEIIVTGLSGEVDRKKLGNVISTVSGEDITKVVSPSAIDAIAGRVPGANVTRSSGTPGAGTYITLRGRKSILGSSEPLYVVDGVIIDNTALYDQNGSKQFGNRAIDINPQDIESMEVLKGASAAALYGSLAGNGVVLITTKKGKLSTTDKPALITFSSSYQSDSKTGSVPLQTKYGQRIPYTRDTNAQQGTPGSTDSYGAILPDGTTVYDQSSVPFRTAGSLENTLTVQGGNVDYNYILSGTFSSLEGTVIGSELDRQNLRFNLGASLFPKLSLQSNNNFIHETNLLPQDGSNRSGILLGALRTPPEFNNSEYLEPNSTQRKFASYDNPLWTQHYNTFESNIQRFIHSSELKWNPIEWLNLTGRVGYDQYEYNNRERLAVGSAASENSEGLIDIQKYTNQAINLDFSAMMDFDYNEDIGSTLVLGVQNMTTSREFSGAQSKTTLSFFDEIAAGATKDASSSLTETKRIGYFAQLTTTLLDRLSLTLGVRHDGSSDFGLSKQFYTYPKVGIAYNLSDESFMSDSKDIIDNIKFRASYGEAGSPTLPGAYTTNYLYGTAGYFDPWDRATSASRLGFNGIRQGGGTSDEFILSGNENIQPELSIEREVGVDFSLFNDRISFEGTFYHTNVHDLILLVPVSGSSGYDRALNNAGSMYNEGFEISLGANIIRNEDVTWKSTFNYSRNYNLVTALKIKPDGFPVTGNEFIDITGGFTGITNVAQVGRPLGVFRGIGWLRDASGNIVYSTSAADDQYGFYINAPQIATEGSIIGDPNPQFSLSWRNDFTFLRDFTFSFLFDGVFGQDIWNGTRGALYNFGTHGDTEDRDELWFNFEGKPVMYSIDEDDVIDSLVQATRADYYQNFANGFVMNEPHIEKGSYIKLREVTLEYRWHGLSDWNIETVNFLFSARNLFTISDYSGFDPEINTFGSAEGRGYDYFSLPQSRAYRFSISLNY